MINLLPINEKMKIRAEYRLRFFTVFGWMLVVLLFSAMIPLAISYYAISYNVKFINEVSDRLTKSEHFKETDAVISEIKDTDRKSIIMNDPVGVSVRQNILGAISSIFQTAYDIKTRGDGLVKITQISYDQATKRVPAAPATPGSTSTTTSAIKDSGIHKISIRGLASDRGTFLDFLKRIENDKNFLSIDSPVSNLLNSTNVDFNLSIILRDRAI